MTPQTQQTIFICPTMCGCVIEATHDFHVSPWRVARMRTHFPHLVDAFLDRARKTGQLDEVTHSYAITQSCDAHRVLETPDALWEEIRHFHGTGWSPDTCTCAGHVWWDDRLNVWDATTKRLIQAAPQHPNEHPLYNTWCAAHAHLQEDPIAHYATLLRENQHKNAVANAIAQAFRWQAFRRNLSQSVARLFEVPIQPMVFNAQRELIVAPQHLTAWQQVSMRRRLVQAHAQGAVGLQPGRVHLMSLDDLRNLKKLERAA